MNYNLDLRSPEYKSKINKYKISSLRIIILLLVLLLPIIICQGLLIYERYLVQQVNELDRKMIVMRREAEPLINMSRDLGELEAIILVEQELLPAKESWSAGLKIISGITPRGLTVNNIEISSGGSVKIYGTSNNMQAPALYQSSLARHSVFKQTELKMIVLNPDHYYDFQINARMQQGDDLVNNDKECYSGY